MWIQAKTTAALVLVVGLVACSSSGRLSQKITQDTDTQLLEGQLTFRNGVLQRTDAKGQLLWQIKVKQAVYRQDQKTAQVKDLVGELFQKGESVFQIKAERAEIHLESQKFSLQGSVVATDLQDGTVLHSRKLEWQPQKDQLILHQILSITHPQIQILAREARVFSRTRQIEAQGQVTALTHQPSLRLRAEHLLWQVPQQKITVDSDQDPARRVQIEHRTQGSGDRAVAGRAQLNLNTKIVVLQPQARLSLLNPPLEVTSQQLFWDLSQQAVFSRQFILVQHRDQKVTLSANQGSLNLARKLVQLTGSVQTIGKRNRSILKSDQLTWLIPTQAIEAQGNVIYQQKQPKFELRGPQAFGKFQEQAILLSGGNVVTEIFP